MCVYRTSQTSTYVGFYASGKPNCRRQAAVKAARKNQGQACQERDQETDMLALLNHKNIASIDHYVSVFD